MPLADENPLPFQLGGGPTPSQAIYAALKSAVGKGGSADPGTTRELWRRLIAIGVSQIAQVKDLAIAQAFAASMGPALPAWERMLLLPTLATDVARRALVGATITQKGGSTGPELSRGLQAVDPQFSIITLPWAQAITSIPGRWLAPLPGSGDPTFGTTRTGASPYAQAAPGFSDSLVERVLYTLAPGVTEIPIASLAGAAAFLNDALPWWKSYDIGTLDTHGGVTGFILDDGSGTSPSLLDQSYL